jgi:hypothetical protein
VNFSISRRILGTWKSESIDARTASDMIKGGERVSAFVQDSTELSALTALLTSKSIAHVVRSFTRSDGTQAQVVQINAAPAYSVADLQL